MPIKILVVDDSASDLLIIKNMLSEYDIQTACDGAEAMQLLHDEDFDLMILDLNMPVMDGFAVLEAFEGSEQFQRPRTIILTNYNELDNEIRGLKLGAADFVRKPIHMDSLKARIDVHVELLHTLDALEQRIKEQTITLETIFDQVSIGIAASFDKEPTPFGLSKYVDINPAFEEITGRKKDELLRMGWAAITHPDDIEKEQSSYEKLLSGEIDSYNMDKRFIKPDGSIVWVHLIVTSLVSSNQYPFSHVALVRDVTEEKVIEKKLIESERSKSVLLSHLQGMAYRCNFDQDWTMQFVSSGCFELTGYAPEALIGNKEISFNELITPEYRESLWNQWIHTLAATVPFRREYEITTVHGARKWVFEIGQGIYNDAGEVEALEGIIIDISERKQMEDQLRYYNEHDAWTDLYNRRYLETFLANDSKLPLTENAALISINLSAMHSLSVTYGFQYGQDLVRRIAKELSNLCTDKHFVFSTHEYRFAFYVKGYKDRNELRDFGSNISSVLTPLLTIDRINVGIGIIEIVEENRYDIELLLKKLLITSEEAVLMSHGENQVSFYDRELENRVSRREILQHELSELAVGKDEERLFLQYQPIIDLQQDRICGFEALARYQNERLGLVSPLEFIPIIEKTKHIVPIGNIIMRKACEFMEKLNSTGHKALSVSINVSVIQILSKGFVDNLLQTITSMEVNPEHIVLELTESAFSSNFPEINRILGRLRSHGIRSSIDDFGTGYSSLSRERELNVDCLKIDKSFIDKLMFLKDNETITGDIISIAHKLGHQAVAEGVEHKKQLEYLKSHGCDKIQGYLISKPLDEQAALDFLKHYESKPG
ncbi:MAG TPA: EAL domain-containing protein [Limnochordia bacterium]|nr:EAL domain-containing protein [Limnochordia bacterium]